MRRLAVVTFLLTLCSCIPNVSYRRNDAATVQSILHETYPKAPEVSYTLSFIEFDDMGELFQYDQLARAVQEIRAAKAKSKNHFAEVVVFIHGWKNNASDNSGNVWGFREMLGEIAQSSKDAHGEYAPVIGVYIGWRGDVLRGDLLKNFSFYDRRNAASRMGHPQLAETLLRVMNAAKGIDESADGTPDDSVCVMVGHSFGGLVMERAIEQSLESLLLRKGLANKALVTRQAEKHPARTSCELDYQPPGDKPPQLPVDLIILLNEAGPATEGKQFLEFLSGNDIRQFRSGRNQPLIISMTSTGDTATRLAFPAGQSVSRLFHDLRTYRREDDSIGVPKQSSYYLQTVANMGVLQGHAIVDQAGLEAMYPNDPDKQKKCTYSTVTVQTGTAAAPAPKTYYVVRMEQQWNTTPYWVMQMPVAIVPDHSNIFRKEFRDLVWSFIERKNLMEPLRSR